MDIEWVRIVSAHIVLTPTRMFNTYKTLCGRRASGDTYDTPPAGKSCESCLRIFAKRSTT